MGETGRGGTDLGPELRREIGEVQVVSRHVVRCSAHPARNLGEPQCLWRLARGCLVRPRCGRDKEHAARTGRAVVARLLANRKDLLLVTGLGSPSYDATAAGDHAKYSYLWGAMGSAAMLGPGLAAAQPQHSLLVHTGDGVMLLALCAPAPHQRVAPSGGGGRSHRRNAWSLGWQPGDRAKKPKLGGAAAGS